jgi:hypothetical protein
MRRLVEPPSSSVRAQTSLRSGHVGSEGTNALHKAERELDAATTRAAINAAAPQVMLDKAELKQLERKAASA